MINMKHLIVGVEKNSIADKLGIVSGDFLISVNGYEIKDVFDYRYHAADERVLLLTTRADGEEKIYNIKKPAYRDIGLIFENGLMDDTRRCANKCIFCFIDQLPRDMRETLYVKDDDPRLSFLTGNYVTLTNIGSKELERIIYYHLSPINISIHATDTALRADILGTPRATAILEQLKRISDAGITMNFQIVLCKGINDGTQLDKTIYDLSHFIPRACSLSVVPVGLSAHRAGLHHLEPFSPADAAGVIDQITGWQERLTRETGSRFVFAADEFYLRAGMALPPHDEYEGFPQLENGVGMLSLFQDEFLEELEETHDAADGTYSVITGVAAAEFMKGLVVRVTEKFPQIIINVYPIINNCFGDLITVSGLLTGADIIEQMKGRELSAGMLVPRNALREADGLEHCDGEFVFLDDYTVSQVSAELGINITVVDTNGSALVRALTGVKL